MQRAATLRKERSLKRAARSVQAAAAALDGQEEVLRQRQEAVEAEAELVLTAKQVGGAARLGTWACDCYTVSGVERGARGERLYYGIRGRKGGASATLLRCLG
jgi:hypothetical protein